MIRRICSSVKHALEVRAHAVKDPSNSDMIILLKAADKAMKNDFSLEDAAKVREVLDKEPFVIREELEPTGIMWKCICPERCEEQCMDMAREFLSSVFSFWLQVDPKHSPIALEHPEKVRKVEDIMGVGSRYADMGYILVAEFPYMENRPLNVWAAEQIGCDPDDVMVIMR